jgi:hypothetical protein
LKLAHLSPEQRADIGKLLVDTYAKSGIKPELKQMPKVESVEPEGTFLVLSYPRRFNDLMDAVILKYVAEIPQPQPKKERKRIPVKSQAELARSYRVAK